MYTSDISNPQFFEIPDYSSLQLSKANSNQSAFPKVFREIRISS